MTEHTNQPLSTADIARGATTTHDPDVHDESVDRDTVNTTARTEPIRATEAHEPTASTTAPANRQISSDDDTSAPLFASGDAEGFRSRWTDIQAGFVDDPRRSVEQADGLVAEVIKNLADAFANERTGLEQRWQEGTDPSTEDLRVALRRYRSFFDRLLSM
jgi:hypothetical protein